MESTYQVTTTFSENNDGTTFSENNDGVQPCIEFIQINNLTPSHAHGCLEPDIIQSQVIGSFTQMFCSWYFIAQLLSTENFTKGQSKRTMLLDCKGF